VSDATTKHGLQHDYSLAKCNTVP